MAVLLPSFLLSILAIRTVAREEAFLEKRLEESLQAETNHVASLIKTEMNKIQGELNQVLARMAKHDDYQWLSSWFQQQTTLAAIPFFVSPQRDVLWPNSEYVRNANEKFLLEWISAFFKDRAKTFIYQNIALVYKDQILEQSSGSAVSVTQGDAQVDMGRRQKQESIFSSFRSKGQQQLAEDIGDQYAPAMLNQNEPVRQDVYQTAKNSGQQVLKRQVRPAKSISFKQHYPTETSTDSIFIADQLNFSEIMQDTNEGIIPFFIKEELHLIFWKKNADQSVVGCLLDQDIVKSRIIRLLPLVFSQVRILSVLDENGKPIISPTQNPAQDWKQPFVASEISELLPRWEVVAYLSHPEAISLKAQTTGVFIWILILILLLSIIVGGTLVLKSLHSEIQLAQQKTTFAANVSHELKTPLTSIRMFTEMLLEKRQPDETKQRQYLKIMLSETERLTRLINNVLDFSLMGKSKRQYQFKEIDIVSLCRSIVEAQRMRLEFHGFHVSFSTDQVQTIILGDEEALKQVMLNLLSNAEKYSDEVKDIAVDIINQDRKVIINIKDKGIGITTENAKFIFNEFYRVDDSLTTKKRGTGLGLTIAQRIVTQHGGDILYLPHQGGGSIFQIQLPVLKE